MTPPAAMPASSPSQHVAMAALCLVTGAIALVAYMTGAAGAVEAIAFVSGAICVWLVVRQSIWNFPLGLINVAASAYVFFGYKLFADASLQIVYFLLNLAGWYLWLHGGKDRTALTVERTSPAGWLLIAAFIALATYGLHTWLSAIGGASRFWDALTTAISLAAQGLLSRKRLENWHLWILADVIYVPLYASRGLYLMAVLYAVFLVMAVIGLISWRKQLKQAA